MRPFAVINAILFGSAAAITFGLCSVLIIYLVLQGRHPQLAAEFGPLVRSGSLSLEEIAELRTQGAVGDVLGNYVDSAGTVIPAPHDSRLIGLSIEDLRHIGSVVAVASGDEKPRAILGALRAGIVDVLIVDEANAREVIGLARAGGG